jgi:hypothetical protein
MRTFKRWSIVGAILALLVGGGVAVAQLPNTLNISSAPSGSAPAIRASGIDANVSINLVPKGAGTVQVSGTPITVSGGTFTSLNVNPGPLNVTGSLFVQPGSAATLKRVGAVIAHNITDAPTVGTALETLYTFAIEANTLANDGESIEIDVALTTAANANNKTATIAFGGTTMVSTGAIAANAETITMRCHIYRTGAATQKAHCQHRHSVTATDNADMFGGNRVTTPAETLSGAVNLIVTGTTPTAAADLTARIAKVYWHPVGQ